MLSATTLFPAGALSQRSRVSTARPAARGSWAHRRAASSQHAIPSCGNLVSPRPASMASPKKHGRGAAAHASKSEARVSVNLVLWFAQLVAASPLVPLITGGVAGAYAGELRTLIQPSPPFFGVWGLLYMSTCLHMYWILSNKSSPLAVATTQRTSVVWACMAAWACLAGGLPDPAKPHIQAVLVVLLGAAAAACVSAVAVASSVPDVTDTQKLVVVAPLAGLAGWLTLATVLNAADVAMTGGVAALSYASPAQAPAAVALLGAGLVGASALSAARSNPWMASTLVYGFIGAALSNALNPGHPYVAAAAVAAALLCSGPLLRVMRGGAAPRTA